MGAKTLLSVEQFDRLLEPDEFRYELDEGELIEMVRPRYNPHNRIVRAIDRVLLQYLAKNPIGEVLSSDNLFVLGPATKRAPDLAFLSLERVQRIKPGHDIEGAPELVVEVLSPSDKAEAMRRKIRQYFAAGARLVWLVYPNTREIEVWESASSATRILGQDDLLEAPELLPGFSCPVKSLF
ncbi:MAG: Uma2 family endonuclease [Bryobacterales bacterium]|nr:Uma2 family endonuclease [Bryobacterales bacterium]